MGCCDSEHTHAQVCGGSHSNARTQGILEPACTANDRALALRYTNL
jgi:hypothetical protein